MKKLLFIVLLATLGFVATSSCKSSRSKNDEEKKPTFRLGVMPSMDYVPFAFAKREGIYDSLKLELNIVKFFSANDRDAAFQSGNIDGTIIDYTGAMLQQANGIALHLIMKTDGDFDLISSRASETNSLFELKDKQTAISRNTVIEYAFDKFLEHEAISEQQIKKLEINKIPLRLEMLENGNIEASVFPNPFSSIAQSRGHKKIISTKEMGISITGVACSDRSLSEKKSAIKLLIKGYNIAVSEINKSKATDEKLKIVLIEDVGFPESLLADFQIDKYTFATLPKFHDLESTSSWLKKKKLIPAEYKAEQLLDKTFIPEQNNNE